MSFDFDNKFYFDEDEKFNCEDKCEKEEKGKECEEKEDREFFAVIPVKIICKRKPKPCPKPRPCPKPKPCFKPCDPCRDKD